MKKWTYFKYDYPDFADLWSKSQNQLRTSILKDVTTLYGPAESVTPSADMIDWYVRIKSAHFALRGTYTVFLFLGTPSTPPYAWFKAPELIGLHTVFAYSGATGCANYESQKSDIDEGFVHITKNLVSLDLLTRSEREIVNYLRDNLKWRILGVGSL